MYIPWRLIFGLLPSAAPPSFVSKSRDTTLVIPGSRPPFALPITAQLAGLSIEMDRWPDWVGPAVGKPNLFFNQLLQNLADRTGEGIIIRVGADSEDRAHLDLCYEVYNSTFPPPTDTVPVPEASSIAIGRDFYALSANLPAGTRFTWGLNLKFLNLSETLAQARLLADTFQGSRADQLKHVILENVEIGNEPDLYYYSASGFGESWTPHNYSEVWKKHAKAVSEVVNLSTDKTNGIPTLWMGSFTVINMMMVWTPTAVLESGLLDGESGKYASTFCEHHYNGVFGRDRLPGVGELMDKAGVRGNLSLFAESIRVSRASGLDFVLGETSSYANHGAPGTSNTAEAAIWAVDYILHAASIGIDRLYLSNGVGYRYNLLQPISGAPNDGLNLTDRPHILPIYHAFLFVNEAIGLNGKGRRIAEISTTDTSLAVYGIWEGEDLKRLVFINSEVYLPDQGKRGVIRVKPFVALSAQEKGATLRRLYTPYTSAYSGLTWAGQSFDTTSGVPDGEVQEEVIHDEDLEIEASSVVLMTL